MSFLRRLFHFFRTPSDQDYRPVVLITGCATGLGLALGKLLTKVGRYRVVLTAREKSFHRLREEFAESPFVMIQPLDVTSEASRMSLIREIEKTWGGIDILINNAGISYRAVVEHMTEADELNQLQTNYLGPMGLIREVIPHMRENGWGKIINVSSVSGMLAMPTMSSYSASKHALEGASEALWYEMRPFGIHVTLIQPGFIHSGSFKNVYYTEKSKPESTKNGPYSDYYENMTPFVEKLMNFSTVTPDSIAKKILKVIRTENPPLWIPVTPDAYIFYYIRRLMPRRLLLPFLFACLPHARTWGRLHTKKRHFWEMVENSP